jgi:hypothetical protein
MNTYTGFIAWGPGPPYDGVEEIDVRATNEREAREQVQQQLDKPGEYEPGGRVVHIEERFGLFF